MNRRLLVGWICFFIFLFTTYESSALENPERHKALDGMGKSLMWLQEGVRGVVTGFLGIGEHTAKFLFYGSRDGLRTMGRGAGKADRAIQEKLW